MTYVLLVPRVAGWLPLKLWFHMFRTPTFPFLDQTQKHSASACSFRRNKNNKCSDLILIWRQQHRTSCLALVERTVNDAGIINFYPDICNICNSTNELKSCFIKTRNTLAAPNFPQKYIIIQYLISRFQSKTLKNVLKYYNSRSISGCRIKIVNVFLGVGYMSGRLIILCTDCEVPH